MYIVYQHKNKINGKIYFGITSRKPVERWGRDGSGYKSTPHFFSAIKKYGWDNFEHNILKSGLTKEEACQLERQLIKQYQTQNPLHGYNVLEGGEAPIIPLEVRQKMSLSMRGNKNGFGHPCSAEKKKKISEAQKGRPLSLEHRAKLSEAAKKRHVPCSEEKRQTLSQKYPHKRKVYCIETNVVYPSVQECARQLNLHATTVSKVCKGIHHTTGGYHLKYYDDTVKA